MANWKRRAILILCAVVAWLLSLLVPLAPFYQPLIAVSLFVVLARLLKVGSYLATLVFALLLACALPAFASRMKGKIVPLRPPAQAGSE